MTEFGEQLRKFRHQCNDSKSPHGKLTQEKFGDLIGEELGISYTGAAISDWERGKSKIHADDRLVLRTIIKILYQCGGLKTVEEANELLETGNYRALDDKETENIFREAADHGDAEQSKPVEETESFIRLLMKKLFIGSEEELQILIKRTKEGPSPSWPRFLAAFIRKASERFSVSLTTVLWIWVWFFAWWLTGPSLRWPFANRDLAFRAIGMYVAGTLIIPLLIGLLINTKDNPYWKQQNLANSIVLRLYTYQGAGIGFNLGYFFVFPFALVRYYLHLEPSVWLEFAAIMLGLILANMSARVVPHNLWMAYGRLRFADGAIFFVVALLGPLWGMFFMEYYSFLLKPLLGSILILLAMTVIVIIGVRHSRKTPEIRQQ